MTAIALKHFDVLGYVEKSKALGVDEKVAAHQARQIEQAIDIAVSTAKTEIENKELATKGDLKALELANRNDIKALELATKNDIKALELATKNDIKALEALIYKSKAELIIWVTGLLIASGLIQHFFK